MTTFFISSCTSSHESILYWDAKTCSMKILEIKVMKGPNYWSKAAQTYCDVAGSGSPGRKANQSHSRIR